MQAQLLSEECKLDEMACAAFLEEAHRQVQLEQPENTPHS